MQILRLNLKKLNFKCVMEAREGSLFVEKIKSRTKIFCCRFVKKLAEKHHFPLLRVIGQEIKFLPWDVKKQEPNIIDYIKNVPGIATKQLKNPPSLIGKTQF